MNELKFKKANEYIVCERERQLTSINEPNNNINLVLGWISRDFHGFFPNKTHEVPWVSCVQLPPLIRKYRYHSRHLCRQKNSKKSTI